ncbi:FAD-dependent oxidoreductase [Streptosporangium sp. NPDC020072]|uniref:FAD-dependent oxidoreductase n=1 Tax=Streptosporangium sp. NPDC020072 TaxID=3154788 RepID=UPI003414E8D5
MRVIVIGAGVAGSAAALALRHIGAEVTVYEAYADPAGDVGSFISLAANGLRGLEALGCLPRVQRLGVALPRQRMWSASGRLLGDVPRGRRGDDPLHSVTLMRGALVEALRAAAAEAGAEIVTGERLTGVTEAPGAVTAGFLDGRRDSADLLVAADGIWSLVRGVLDPAAPRPRYAGLYCVSGVSADARGLGVEPGVFNMTFARNGAFIHLAAGDGTVWWSAQIADPRQPRLDDAAEAGAGWLRETAALYRREPVPSAVLAAAVGTHPTVLMHALGPVPTWHGGRSVLIGDAAHPVGAGQGASMAVEDALVLAAALRGRAPSDVPGALARYDAARRPRVTRLLGAAKDNREAKKAGPVARRAQAAAMRLFLPLFYDRSTAWLHGHDPAVVVG